MTRELMTALLSDDIFRTGLGFGILFGMVLGYACSIGEYIVAKLLKRLKNKEDKEKWQCY